MTRASVSSSEYVSLFRPEMEHYVMRCNHTAVFLEPMIYVFGGSDGITAFNTLGAFNLDTRVWAEVPVEKVSPSCPCARTKHAACLVRWNHKDYLYIYGGIDGTRYLSDFWRCDLATGVFEEIHGVSQRSPPPPSVPTAWHASVHPSWCFSAACPTSSFLHRRGTIT